MWTENIWWGGRKEGKEGPKTAQKYAKNPQTDFFQNTETASTWRPQYESYHQQDL